MAKVCSAAASLPSIVLLEVFSHLDLCSLASCAEVSSTWRAVAFSRKLWQSVDISSYARVISHVGHAVRSCPSKWPPLLSLAPGSFLTGLTRFAKELVIRYPTYLINDDIAFILKALCPSNKFLDDPVGFPLESLSLEFYKSNADSICIESAFKVVLESPNIHSFSLHGSHFHSISINVTPCRSMKSIDLTFSLPRRFDLLEQIPVMFPNLSCLAIGHNLFLDTDALPSVLHGLPNLSQLSLPNTSLLEPAIIKDWLRHRQDMFGVEIAKAPVRINVEFCDIFTQLDIEQIRSYISYDSYVEHSAMLFDESDESIREYLRRFADPVEDEEMYYASSSSSYDDNSTSSSYQADSLWQNRIPGAGVDINVNAVDVNAYVRQEIAL
ncbi:uncharacterized protein V1516DRAFT_674586 [Lipomyces oligophaga]|uniref:uncharacterized protein n=1 Tax=Lipomyces oligophaga TaxID=45792 RepID=UPI0034CEF041